MDVICPVFITAKCKSNEPQELWSRFNLQDRKIFERSCVGTLVRHCLKYYIITCYHLVKNHISIEVFVPLRKTFLEYPVQVLGSIKEYDFTVLQFTGDTTEIEKVGDSNIGNLVKNVETLSDQNDIELKYIYRYCKNVVEKNISVTYNGYIFSKVTSELYPRIPIITISINISEDEISPELGFDDSSYEGLSGSLLTARDKIYGIISYYDQDNKLFNVIPSYCFELFLDMVLQKDYIKAFCFSTDICNYDDKNVGHIISKTHGITYRTDMDKEIKFKNSDLIESINGNTFNDDGNIYMEKLRIQVPVDTYVLLENSKYYTIKYYSKKDDSYVEFNKKVYTDNIAHHLKFNFEYCTKFIKFKGLVITEMSEELLKYYDAIGIPITGNVMDHYNKCYTANNQKIVIIVNIDHNISEDLRSTYKTIGLPLMKDVTNKYCIGIISKIDGTKIDNIEHFEKYITINNDKDVSLKVDLARKTSFVLKYSGSSLTVK